MSVDTTKLIAEMREAKPYTIPCPQEDDPYMVIGPGVSEECDDYDHADHLCRLLNRASRVHLDALEAVTRERDELRKQLENMQ